LPDARRSQGRRHRVGCVLACAAAAVLAGARTYADLATVAGQLRAVRAWRNKRTGHYEPPSEATFWRVLSEVPAQALDDVLGQWQLAHAGQQEAIAVDGKTVRGAGVHLFSAFLHTAQAVVSQQRVPEKTNEITCLPAAQDLLLTYLDHMPPNTAFIGTSNLDLRQFTERFQSRLQQFKVSTPENDDIEKLIKRWKVAKVNASQIAVGCGGNVRAALLDAQSFLDAEAA
jgi:hypothetical protein